MTAGGEVVSRLGQPPKNVPISSALRSTVLLAGSARDGSEGRRSFVPVLATKDAYFAGTSTGATGLEPATSGVTGRYGLNRYSGLAPGITG